MSKTENTNTETKQQETTNSKIDISAIDYDALACVIMDAYESDRAESGRKEIVKGIKYTLQKYQTAHDREIIDDKKLYIGTYEEFAHQKVKLQEQRKRLQISLRNTSGGHGRKKKLQALERLKAREKQYTETVCHKISKRIVDFALKNHAKYINLENLQGYDTNEFILRNWCYYRLQQYTEYKAARYGIIVRKVNPCYNAQICSICGGWDKDQRLSRADFICKDPNCISHKKYKHPQCAEFNNARNVAMSELFMESGKVTGKDFERARAYYSKKNPGIIWEFVESKE